MSPARIATLVAVPVALVAGLISFLVLGGFRSSDGGPTTGPTRPSPAGTGPVAVPGPALSGAPAAVCAALIDRLPGAVRDAARRPVDPPTRDTAAYGDPPITLACGTPAPSFALTDQLFTLDGVCWHSAEVGGGTTWTTVDRTVPVTVGLPTEYQPPTQWVIVFSAPVAAAIPPTPSKPSGCGG